MARRCWVTNETRPAAERFLSGTGTRIGAFSFPFLLGLQYYFLLYLRPHSCRHLAGLQTVMKVEALTLREIQMPLVHFFETSFGRTYSRRILLVTMHCDGVDGWAESVAGEDPYYSSEWTESAWSTIKQYLAPAALGHALNSASESVPMMAKVRGHRMAKAAVENAIWDAEAKQRKQPLWKLLGGTRQE